MVPSYGVFPRFDTIIAQQGLSSHGMLLEFTYSMNVYTNYGVTEYLVGAFELPAECTLERFLLEFLDSALILSSSYREFVPRDLKSDFIRALSQSATCFIISDSLLMITLHVRDSGTSISCTRS